jgi:hypothetical protein
MMQAILSVVAVSFVGCIVLFVAFGFAELIRRWA